MRSDYSLARDLLAVMKLNKDLGIDGWIISLTNDTEIFAKARWPLLSGYQLTEFRICIEYLEKYHKRGKKWREKETSYAMKQNAEIYGNMLIPNGTFIAAALALGYEHQKVGVNSIFKISKTTFDPDHKYFRNHILYKKD